MLDVLPMTRAAMVAVTKCLAAHHNESALVVTDTERLEIAGAFLLAFHAVGTGADQMPNHYIIASTAGPLRRAARREKLSKNWGLSSCWPTCVVGESAIRRIGTVPGVKQGMHKVGSP